MDLIFFVDGCLIFLYVFFGGHFFPAMPGISNPFIGDWLLRHSHDHGLPNPSGVFQYLHSPRRLLSGLGFMSYLVTSCESKEASCRVRPWSSGEGFILLRFLGTSVSLNDMFMVNEFRVFLCELIFCSSLVGFWSWCGGYCGVNLNGLEDLFDNNADVLCTHA